MNKKDLNERIEGLNEEVGYIGIKEEFRMKGESHYLGDYIYGISDIRDLILNELSKNSLDSSWRLVNRVIVKREEFKKKEYHKLKTLNENIFLARDKEDLKSFFDCIKKSASIDIEKEYNKIIGKIKEVFLGNTDVEYIDVFQLKKEENRESDKELVPFKENFDELLKKYILASESQNKEAQEKAIYNLGNHLNKSNRVITKTKFFQNVLKINNAEISSIQKKFKEKK